VEDGASIGSGATILCGVRIGAGAQIGAGAVVTKDTAAGVTVVGNPAAPLR
jgi:UDP-2-acetamido-3-amino-2,3-dideoxy-glucuronate N-acetyltransferase